MNKSLVLMGFLFAMGLALLPSHALAAAHYEGYDSIVRSLAGASTTATVSTPDSDPLANVKFHIAVGAIASHLMLTNMPSLPSSAELHGVNVDLGIDLFSPYWQAVGTITSFQTDYEHQTQLQMKEFGMLVQHKMPLENSIAFVLGAGLTARYLSLSGNIPSGVAAENTTPASEFDGGLDFGITQGFSVDINAAYEAALVHQTADAGSINGTVMLAGTF